MQSTKKLDPDLLRRIERNLQLVVGKDTAEVAADFEAEVNGWRAAEGMKPWERWGERRGKGGPDHG